MIWWCFFCSMLFGCGFHHIFQVWGSTCWKDRIPAYSRIFDSFSPCFRQLCFYWNDRDVAWFDDDFFFDAIRLWLSSYFQVWSSACWKDRLPAYSRIFDSFSPCFRQVCFYHSAVVPAPTDSSRMSFGCYTMCPHCCSDVSQRTFASRVCIITSAMPFPRLLG